MDCENGRRELDKGGPLIRLYVLKELNLGVDESLDVCSMFLHPKIKSLSLKKAIEEGKVISESDRGIARTYSLITLGKPYSLVEFPSSSWL